MNIKKYDLLLVDYPYTNLQSTKLRPALVLKVLEGKNIILCQITTKKQLFENYSVFLPKTACLGEIKFDSYINLDILFTLEQSRVRRKIGFVKDPNVINEVSSKLKSLSDQTVL